MRLIITHIIFLLSITLLNAQPKVYMGVIENEDTLLLGELPEFILNQKKWSLEKKDYLLLKYRMKKVYPFAQEAIRTYYALNDTIDQLKKKRKKRKVVRSTQKELKENFLDELMNLSISQGKVMVMLISRGTDKSCYELIKTFKGNMNAMYWQGIGRFFTYNLKDQYCADENPEFEFLAQSLDKENP